LCIAFAAKNSPQFSDEVIEEGVRIVETFMKTWAGLPTQTDDNGDVDMTDELSGTQQLEKLKQCFAEFQSQIASNAWVQHLLADL
jgi:hypothetical protein